MKFQLIILCNEHVEVNMVNVIIIFGVLLRNSYDYILVILCHTSDPNIFSKALALFTNNLIDLAVTFRDHYPPLQIKAVLVFIICKEKDVSISSHLLI